MSGSPADHHEPVMLHEAIEALAVRPAGVYVDGTFGRGGHAREILARLGDAGRLIAFDKDPDAVSAARTLFDGDPRFSIDQGSFVRLPDVIAERGLVGRVNGLLLDLGVSSPQLDDPARGFSFSVDGPLDMRMDPTSGVTASEWLAAASEAQITDALRTYGEERFARRIARSIKLRCAQGPIRSTGELAELVARACPVREKHKHPATRTFQALRIVLNRELDDIATTLRGALELFCAGARLVVISFHSLEDRIVKRFFKEQAQGPKLPKGLPVTHRDERGRLRLLGGARKPSAREVARNPRARSAVMRVAEVLA